jgi:hypothetical protein
MILALKDAARLSSHKMPSHKEVVHQMAEIRNVWTAQERKHRAELSLLRQLKLLAECGAIDVADEPATS